MQSSIKAYWESSRSVAVRERCKDAFAVTLLLLLGVSASRWAAALPPDFQETVVFSGLNEPTALQFSPDGRVFVAEKRGVVQVFDNLSDPTPTVFADLRTNVYNVHDRGLLGLAVGTT